jgi:hypothetical protein
MAVDAGRYSRSLRMAGRMTTELRRLERHELDRVIAGDDPGDDTGDDGDAPEPVLAEGTGAIRAVAPAPENLTDLVQELVTPLTVLMAVQQRMVAAVARGGDPELLAELRRYSDRGQDALESIHRVLAELRTRT